MLMKREKDTRACLHRKLCDKDYAEGTSAQSVLLLMQFVEIQSHPGIFDA